MDKLGPRQANERNVTWLQYLDWITETIAKHGLKAVSGVRRPRELLFGLEGPEGSVYISGPMVRVAAAKEWARRKQGKNGWARSEVAGVPNAVRFSRSDVPEEFVTAYLIEKVTAARNKGISRYQAVN